jgi:1,4-dihydroxy-2-naphthoyl-CoA hydrolase
MLIDDCDAAGVVFGPRLAALAHQAYEEVLAAVGIDLAALVRGVELALPYVHLECEFRAPLRHGDEIAINVIAGRIGNSSYTVHIDFLRGQESCARVSQTHVAIACATRSKIDLPADLRQALAALTVCPS